MTKPSNFILNSDYLTIAQASSTEPYTVYFASQPFPTTAGVINSFHIDQEIPSNAVAGAVDRVVIEYNGTRYVADRIDKPADPLLEYELEYDQFWILTVFRKDRTTLVARVTYFPPTRSSSVPSTPALTFTISATSFRPPNVV
jgi:hypothetical protein